MIISASYRTDIPAFYSQWFINRLRAKYCLVKNPYGGQINKVSLHKQDVDGFVFWTRNIGPLMPYLDEIREIAPFNIQMTITNYPSSLEKSVISSHNAIEDLKKINDKYGDKTVVWRYDPIFLSPNMAPAMTIDWHLNNFSNLAKNISGIADEVIISFMQYYKKIERNMIKNGIKYSNYGSDEKAKIIIKLSEIAKSYGFKLTLCTQPKLISDETPAARCIDARRIAKIGGKIFKSRLKANRPGCLCDGSIDIGCYESCVHGCVYCYAVGSEYIAKNHYKSHDSTAEYL